MPFKVIFFCILVGLPNVLALSTFSLVIDTTVSMKNEIDIINRHLVKTINATSQVSATDYYVVVPFNYPDVQTHKIARNTIELQAFLEQLSANGGEVCPENSLAGIIKALEISERKTNIFVFTDAYARDENKFDQVKDLCERTESRVVIFLSGHCVSTDKQDVGSVQVYSRIAEACSGLLVYIEPSNLKQTFKYMKELISDDWTDVVGKRSLTGEHHFTLPVKNETNKGLMIAVSGDFPLLEIVDTNGITVQTKVLLDTKHALAVRVLHLESTEYKISVSSRGITSMLIYSVVEKLQIIKHGFSTVVPRNLNETSTRPIPGWPNYTLLTVSSKATVTLNFIEFRYFDGSNSVRLNLTNHGSDNTKTYITNALIVPDKNFEIYVEGTNDDNYEVFNATIDGVVPQRTVRFNESYWMEPKIELLDEDKEIEYGTNLTLACKVTAYPRPVIRWTNVEVENDFETVLLEIPSVHISYLKLTNVTKGGTYYCEAQHAKGKNRKSIDISLHNIFDVLQIPADKTIEYGTGDKLTCEAKTSAEVTMKWLLNDTHIDEFDVTSNRHAVSELKIKNMTLSDVGTYTCEITTPMEVRKFSADITISGLEAPVIEKSDKISLNLKPGSTEELECRISRGKPTPEIIWKYAQDDYADYFDSLPYGVQSQGGLLQFYTVKREQKGLYRCVASNDLGSDYQDISVKVEYAPIIETSSEVLEVREGLEVALNCEVDADPPASIQWRKNDYDLVFGDRFYTDPDGRLVFYALWKDAGEYQCIAENEHGNALKQVKLNVLVAPYIEPAQNNVISVRRGQSVTLSCNVLYGYPKPEIVWEYQNVHEINDLKMTTREPSSLLLNNVTEIHQGHYFCVATNKVGSDRIRYDLKLIL